MADILSYRKLQAIKEIRSKMFLMDKQNARVTYENDAINVERTRLANYHRELALLQQEKLAHVEELRIIHVDLNTMEQTIKSSELYLSSMVKRLDTLNVKRDPLMVSIEVLKSEIGINDSNSHLQTIKCEPNIASTSNIGLAIAQAPPPLPPTSMMPPNTLSSLGSFHQQPPPMKACQSCHQQIHRNAPICPLCKAKSRSRNPKKSKRNKTD